HTSDPMYTFSPEKTQKESKETEISSPSKPEQPVITPTAPSTTPNPSPSPVISISIPSVKSDDQSSGNVTKVQVMLDLIVNPIMLPTTTCPAPLKAEVTLPLASAP